jgi:hypothetical protein
MSFRISAAFGLVIALASSLSAEDPAEIVKRTKRATALVQLNGKATGTAFCIERNGLFVTDRRVVDAAIGSEVRLVLNSGETEEKRVQAKLIRSDPDTSLALLQVEGADGSPLSFGKPEELVETMPLTAFGYTVPPRSSEKQLGVTVNISRVTSLRKVKGRLTVIVLDAMLKLPPGNAGGPVIDADGRVVGIIKAGFPANSSYINSATSASELIRLLDTPEIAFEVTTLDEAQSLQPHTFPIRIDAIRRPLKEWKVEVEFQEGDAEPRRLEARMGQKEGYEVNAVLMPNGLGPDLVRVEAEFPEGSLKGRTVDLDVTVGDQAVRLSKVRSLEPGTAGQPPKVRVGDQEIHGTLRGLEEASVDLGKVSAKVDLTKATRITFAPIERMPGPVNYRVVVRDGERVAAEARGQVAIAAKRPEKAPLPPAANESTSPPDSANNPVVERSPFTEVLALTERAPKNWILKEAKIGVFIRQDREYAFTGLPKEMVGGTLIWRATTDGWLDPAAVTVLKPCFAYAIVRTREHGKVQFDEVALTKFIREGWEQVSEPVTTNVDGAFDTRWIALRKAIPAGQVVLQLHTIGYGHAREATVFAFKAGGGAKPDAGDVWPETVRTGLFKSDVMEFTDKASPNWIFREARVGTDIWSDKGYFLTHLPKEIAGGTMLVRGSGDENWPAPATLTALADCTAYALIRSKYLGKETVGEVSLAKLEREGWTRLDGKTAVTFPNGEGWQWVVLKKRVTRGPVALPGEGARTPVILVFKR